MLRLLVPRARAQWPLLAALLAVVAIGATMLGTCALLVTRTSERALEAAVARAGPADVDVTAYTVTVSGPDARGVAADTRAVVASALAPFPATTAVRATSALRWLPGARGQVEGTTAETYLSGMQNLPARAALRAGRWPRASGATGAGGTGAGASGALEAVVLEATANQLGLTLGSRVHIGTELNGDARPADVTVVGIVRPLPGTGWERDLLGGTGYDAAYHDGRSAQPVHVYGPFVVDLADLFAGGSALQRLEVTGHPDLHAATRPDLDRVAASLSTADGRLAGVLGNRVELERLDAPLPLTLQTYREQQQVTGAGVLAVAVLGAILTATALALAGRLTAGVRAEETALLSALGTGRRQAAAAAAGEAGALAIGAAAIAVPASSALHAGLSRMAPLAGAGLTVAPTVTVAQVLAVAVGAVALAAVLVVLALRPAAAVAERRHRRELLARSGADVLLVAFAGVGWWQLRAQPSGASARADAIRVLAPALLLAAGAALALRLVLPALRVADRLAGRARGLVLPLAAFDAARRPRAVAAGLLIGLACAAGTFGVAFDATWARAQHDQADLSVGTDLAVTLTAPPVAGQGAVVRAATGGAVSPAADRGIAVGQWLGSAGDPPRLVAVDTTRAAALLRGRLDRGRTWPAVAARLAPTTQVAGVPVPLGAAMSLGGTATGSFPISVTPRLLLQDATGLRTACTGPAIPLDGRAYPMPACATAEGLRLVAVSLPFTADLSILWRSEAAGTSLDSGPSRVAVTLTLPGTAGTSPPWTATSAAPAPGQLENPAVAIAGTPGGTRVTMTTTMRVEGPPDAADTLVATAFPDPGPVPVAISTRFARAIGAHPGSRLNLTIDTTPVPVVVTTVVPTVPGAPGAAAVLADLDALSRTLAIAGDLDYPVDAWWVGHPAHPDAAAALHLGTVATRDGEAARLTSGPLRAGVPAALLLLVPAAALLLLAGVILHVTCDLRARELEVARLRGIGLSRRGIRGVLLGQHAGVLLPLIAAGAGVGALATRLMAPLLVRSDTGAAPVPGALPRWPWPTEAALLLGLVAACTLAVTVVVSVQARRADAAHLRVTS